jgi:hypothetical protein
MKITFRRILWLILSIVVILYLILATACAPLRCVDCSDYQEEYGDKTTEVCIALGYDIRW